MVGHQADYKCEGCRYWHFGRCYHADALVDGQAAHRCPYRRNDLMVLAPPPGEE